MIFTFYRALGYNVGKSLVEEEFIPLAKELLDKANAKGVKFFLPEDVIIADEFKADANSKTVRLPLRIIANITFLPEYFWKCYCICYRFEESIFYISKSYFFFLRTGICKGDS